MLCDFDSGSSWWPNHGCVGLAKHQYFCVCVCAAASFKTALAPVEPSAWQALSCALSLHSLPAPLFVQEISASQQALEPPLRDLWFTIEQLSATLFIVVHTCSATLKCSVISQHCCWLCWHYAPSNAGIYAYLVFSQKFEVLVLLLLRATVKTRSRGSVILQCQYAASCFHRCHFGHANFVRLLHENQLYV